MRRGFTCHKCSSAFTLAELLIALAILGVIAVFTIPKVLQSQANNQYNAAGHEMLSTISAAYSAYKLKNTPTASTSPSDLSPYLNYVRIDSTSDYDGWNSGTGNCGDAGTTCLAMHTGGVLVYDSPCSFGGTGNLDGIYFRYDHDKKISGDVSLGIVLFFNGRVTSRSGLPSGTNACGMAFSANPDPSWFKW